MRSTESARREMAQKSWSLIEDLLPPDLCDEWCARLDQLVAGNRLALVDHSGGGSRLHLDGGGRYLHFLCDGRHVRQSFPELVALYHALRYWVADLTLSDIVLSPYPDTDVTIHVYPVGGGTVGPHFDTNGITALLYLTDNQEGRLRLWTATHDPWRGTTYEDPSAKEVIEYVPARKGNFVVMYGRRIWHDVEPMLSERKCTVLFNYYSAGDTRRPDGFDDFAYGGSRGE